ncbi:PREDICTED: glucosylceramidase-like [Polistes canadensis]|uniref:glucosylceramidase-like n=1 Tax=Polistes canadensis TaxID=91411 RepID=UPI000718BD45|nr:PREDICTED: glucosylceramidase-like [Polistes canadensis]XP_014615119.1 PREDICTED: glucosylceramidase-like [Polistes canadensis]XP_014615120.1 PREDICTED: glucosylceramidase-like [Polistes canadensis]
MIYKRSLLFIIFFIWKARANDCIPRKFNFDSIVCVCNSTYCDSTPDIGEPEKGSFHVYVSSKDGLRLNYFKGYFQQNNNYSYSDWSNYIKVIKNSIDVSRDKKYQTIQGFGGSFTDSVGINLKNLSKQTQEMLLQSYFGRNGSRYNFGRLPIGGSDFSVRQYSLDDTTEPDKYLEHFELAKEDMNLKIPFIKRAVEISRNLKLTAAVWSPPIWMKTNHKFNGPSVLIKKYYQTYANYLLKFLQSYKSNGIDIWAISTGNEPSSSFVPTIPIPTMGWTPLNLGEWIANYLGPTLARSEFNKTAILALDDQRFTLIRFFDLLASNKKALDYISGIALHWYCDEYFSTTLLDSTHYKYPNKYLLITEASNGFKKNDVPKVQLGSWERAHKYILDIIMNCRHWVRGWIDWNLVLDKNGGPNVNKNFVDAAVIINPENDEFFKQPMYYAIKHFSRFVERDSVRIDSTTTKDIETIAFETPSKMIVVILYNMSSEDKNVTITDSKNGDIMIAIRSYSIYTIIYK